MNTEISETIQATILGLGMLIPEIPAQRKFVSAECHIPELPTQRKFVSVDCHA